MDAVVTYVNAIFVVFIILILIRILMSWIPTPPVVGIGRTLWDFVGQCTDWYLNLFRRVIPPFGMFDLSPIVALIVLYIVRSVVISVLGGF